MSLHVTPSAVSDITNKWELAQRISGHAKAPEQALKSIFTGMILSLEAVSNTQFENSMKERVWEAISGPRLKEIKNTFILEFCDQILGRFSEEQAAEMLEEHKRTGVVKKTEYSTQLQSAFNNSHHSILNVVSEKAKSMTDGLLPDLIAAVKKEGIKLPEPKGTATSNSPTTIPSSVATKSVIPTPSESFAALTNAVEIGDLDKVMEALRNGANPNGSVGVQNIIHLACENGNIDIVRALLDNGANLNSKSSKWYNTPLHRACVFGNTAVVAELIRRGARVDVRNSNCWMTPLENAITSKHLECCKLLIQAGAQVNDVNQNYGSTPLAEACHEGSYEIVKLLLDAGANPNLNTGSSMTPLYQGVHSPSILQLMLERGAKPNTQNGPGPHYQASQYPIHAAASWGYKDSVRILLKAGADPKVKTNQDKTPVELARWQLNNHKTKPCNPPDVTAKMIEDLQEVIDLLEGNTQ